MKKAIKVRNVSKEINGRKILDNINFDIYEGEIVGEFDPKKVNVNELGLYMSGAKRKDNINIYEEDKQ